ncbi:MAG: NYN domain-containing protein [Porticoccaceae bacterium]|nr:NYN domain-containing protein [Porticoccaceae bacterium]
MPKIAIFADVQNIYYTVKESFGCHFNYRELWRQLSLEGDIVLANAYAIDRNDAQQRKFQQTLRNIGFDIKLKPYIQRSDGSAKGDWDVGITIDVMDAVASASHRVDWVVLLSGDGDFDRLLRRVGESGEVQTLAYGASALTAQSLIEATDEFRPIEGALLLR